MTADLGTPVRRCSRCQIEKPLSDFHLRGGDGHQWWCKACHRSYDAAYHARTRPIRLRQKREHKRRLVAWMRDIKTSQPCVDCGGWFHPAAMTFDHLPGHEKLDDIADLVRFGCTRLAREEVLKCEVVCANCHAVRTYMRREAKARASADSSAGGGS